MGHLACRFGLAVGAWFVAGACGGDGGEVGPDPEEPAVQAPIVSDVVDIGNFGDERDIRIRFLGPGPLSDVQEFRVYLAPFGTSPSGDGTEAHHAVPSGDLQSGEIVTAVPGLKSDIGGASIEEGREYQLFVQAWTGVPTESPLSGPSVLFTLAQTNIVLNFKTLSGGTGGVAVGPDGDIYVADFGSQLSGGTPGTKVTRVTPDGTVGTFATGFGGASGNAFDSNGNLFQSDIALNTVSRITPDGTVSVFASQGLSAPVGIAIDNDNTLFVANCGDNTLRKITADGTSTAFASSSKFSCPNGIAVAEDGNFYITNFGNGNMLRVAPDGSVENFVTFPANNLGHVTSANGVLYVTVRGNHQIYEVTLAGDTTLLAGTGLRGSREGDARAATLSFPNGITVSPDGLTLYFNDVAGSPNNPNVISPTLLRKLILTERPRSTVRREG